MKINDFIISSDSSVVDVLSKIEATDFLKIVFVVDKNSVLIGTITDGDIRRGFINGLTRQNCIMDFACKEFKYIKSYEKDFEKLKEYRDNKINAVPVLSKDGKIINIIDFTVIKSLLPVDAFIMAGGLGSRLKPLTNDTPKPLLKVGNKEIISYNFDRLYQFGVFNQFVSVNYMSDQIEKFCHSYNSKINFKIIKEKKFLGTAGSMSLVENFDNDTILLINSVLKPFITDITIISTATPKLIPIKEKIEITFKKPSFFLVFKNLKVTSFSN